ncbi:uncharacterized protein [Periplaneta americana]
MSTQELEAPSGFRGKFLVHISNGPTKSISRRSYYISIVVDDVDAGQEPELEPEPEVSAAETVHASTTDNSTGANKEESDARIKQIQVEAESRKNEFAKLLEEHAQVIKELKQMEDDPPSGAVSGPTEA